jgi:putative tryptophan/tyrosine transport system substrate-binding protein
MRRRDFIKAIASSAAAWPLAGRAQQAAQTRRVGMLTGVSRDDPDAQLRYAAFLDVLRRKGWIDGQNLRVEVRGAGGDAKLTVQYAAELIALAPDVIVAVGSFSAETLLRSTSTVPIVFTIILDPVGAGFVKSISRPGGNATGFMQFEYSLSAKWPELLKHIVPGVTRVAVLRDRQSATAIGQFAVIESVAPSVGIEAIPIGLGDANEIEHDIEAFAGSGNGGLIVAAGTSALVHRDLIVKLALRYKLPAVYSERTFATKGGLISYGPNYMDQYRHAAAYVDRILKGEKPGDLPVQAPTKYELVINLNTAKALGVIMPAALLASADEVIE